MIFMLFSSPFLGQLQKHAFQVGIAHHIFCTADFDQSAAADDSDAVAELFRHFQHKMCIRDRVITEGILAVRVIKIQKESFIGVSPTI